MRLFITNTSPYARKARVLIAEHLLSDRVETVVVDPFAEPPELLAVSPLSKVPVLVTDQAPLIDSRVICEYLDSLARRPLLPTGDEKWRDRARTALGDGIMDAAVAVVQEGRRRTQERSASWTERQCRRIMRTVEAIAPANADELTLGDVAIATALTYLDFRLSQLDWRNHNAPLAVWHSTIERRLAFMSCPLG